MKKKTAGILSSCAAIAVCSSLIVGSTYALFTSESKVNIAVTSGKVEVVATVDKDSLITTSTLSDWTSTEGVFENGGKAGFNGDSVLTLNNITPGDSAQFDIKVVNNSTVNIKYRVNWSVSGELADVLEAELTGAQTDAWTEWAIPATDSDKEKTVSVSVALPEEVGNDYQNKTAEISFAVEAVQGNADVQNILYATSTAEAQELLDNAVDGDTIALKAGNYEKLYLNATSSARTSARTSVRSISDITVKGEEGTILDGLTVNGQFDIDGLTIEGITFVDGINIDSEWGNTDRLISNVTVKNCKTTEQGNYEYTNTNSNNKLISLKNAKNILVSGCTVTNRYQGVYFSSVENLTVENCCFDTLKHNAVAVQSEYFTNSGTFIIKDNTFTNIEDRGIRFSTFEEGSSISVIGNKFTNVADPDDKVSIVKITSNEGVSSIFANNDWDGRSFDEAVLGFTGVTEVTLISTAEELKAFAQDVNSGNNYAGKTVMLGADIDLNNEEWAPIGEYYTSTANAHAFSGTFDGNGHTISNLYVNSDNKNAGLFGYMQNSGNNSPVIKNLTVHNAQVSGVSQVGAVVGNAYQGKLENCHVTGLITVKGNYMVGGLMGYGYARVNNCSVIGDDGSTVTGIYKENDLEGDSVGGLIGYAAELYDTFDNLTVKGVSVAGTRKVGGLIGHAGTYDRLISNVTVENVTVSINATDDYINSNTGKIFVGGVFGEATSGTKITVTGTAINITVNGAVEGTTNAVAGGTRSADLAIDVSGVTTENITVNVD